MPLLQKDIRSAPLYSEVEKLCMAIRSPGRNEISDASEICAATDGQSAVFTATIADSLQGAFPTRIAIANLSTGHVSVLTANNGNDKSPKLSPCGRFVAFISDRKVTGNFQLHLLDLQSGEERAAPEADGWIEYLHWSPSGEAILLGIAGHGADVAGGQGAVASSLVGDSEGWMPQVESGAEEYRWRRICVFDVGSGTLKQFDLDSNIWEAAWCGNDAIVAVMSAGPNESDWYSSKLERVDLASLARVLLCAPEHQIGVLASTQSGAVCAFVQSRCSDRGIVAGDLFICSGSADLERIEIDFDVSHLEWRTEDKLLVTGHRGLETVIGIFERSSVTFSELWSSGELTASGRYSIVSGFGDEACAFICEGFTQGPAIAVVESKRFRQVRSFGIGDELLTESVGRVEPLSWFGSDGLEIQGLFISPRLGNAPYPVVMNIHGGPVWHWRPTWLGRSPLMLSLLRRGFAVFYPNPRGSTGRGQEFVAPVWGDIGGMDAKDLLAGIDCLTLTGRADVHRLGVTGGSYGGFMTSALVTQDQRFAAAVPQFPHTNQVTCRLLGNITQFMDLVLQDKFTIPGGEYFRRSPVYFTSEVKTPTLNICGALDKCTPPEEAAQFYHALRENGVSTALVVYPQEGHGIRNYPAVIDYITRVVSWFEGHMRPSWRRLE